MTSEIVRPSDLAPLKKPLVEAVINARMKDWMTASSSYTLIEAKGGSCADGRFDFIVTSMLTKTTTNVYCSYPEGEWREDVALWFDHDLDDGENVGGGPLPDAKAMFADVETQVDAWIDPWINDCQSPTVFTNQINSIANIAEQLYVGDEVVIGGQGVTPAGDSDSQPTTSAVQDIRSAIDELDVSLGDLHGEAIDALQRTYASDIARTVGGQRALATVAGLAIAGEAVAWNNTYDDLRNFIEQATLDFNSFSKSSGATGTGTTLTAVSGVATIAAGATVGVPPLAAALTVVAGVAAIGSLVFGDEEATPAVQVAVKGSSSQECWESFKTGIKDINQGLTHAEQFLADGCANILADYNGSPDNYSITRRTDQGEQGPKDDLDPFLKSDIAFDKDKMRNVAGAIASIGDHQKALAGIIGGVDGQGNPSAFAQSEWSRGSLPEVGAMGSGYNGPYSSYENVVDALVDLLLLEHRTAHRISEHCVDVIFDFTATDDEREAEMQRLEKQWDTVSIPRANG